MAREKLTQIRIKEDIAANKTVGIPEENIFFLGYNDGMLEYVAQLKWQAACQHTSQMGKGNMKYTGPKMTPEDKEKLKEIIAKIRQ